MARSLWACSSVVEHCVDIAGVASSILATPTISKGNKPLESQGLSPPNAKVLSKPFHLRDLVMEVDRMFQVGSATGI